MLYEFCLQAEYNTTDGNSLIYFLSRDLYLRHVFSIPDTKKMLIIN